MLVGVALDGTHVDCSTGRCRIVGSTMKPGQVALLTFVLCYALIIHEVWGNTCNGGTIEYPYTGNVSITDNGRICQNWSDQTPHPHDFTVEFYVKNEVVVAATSNYCRQPDFDSEPWCYTREPNVRWEYCGVSVCTGSPVCGGEVTTTTGSIHFIDPDQYLGRDCLWTLVAGEHMRIEVVVSYLDIYQDSVCRQTFLEIYEDGLSHGRFCGTSTPTVWSMSNVLRVRFYALSQVPRFDESRNGTGFQASFSHVDGEENPPTDPWSQDVMYGHLRCPPGVDLSLYLGNVSVTDNGRTCQKWSDQYPNSHAISNEHHFHHDGGKAETENYCRNVGRLNTLPFCITTDTTYPVDTCAEHICSAYGPVCGGMITRFPGNLTAIDRDSNGYDRNRDCIWTLQAAENHIIILTVHYLKLQRAPDCQKDSLQITEKTMDYGKFCGTSTPIIRSETSTVTVHYKTDDTGKGNGGFHLEYSQESIYKDTSTPKATTTTVSSNVTSQPRTTIEDGKLDNKRPSFKNSTPSETRTRAVNTTSPVIKITGSPQSTVDKQSGPTSDSDPIVSTRSDSQITPETVNSGSAILSKTLTKFEAALIVCLFKCITIM